MNGEDFAFVQKVDQNMDTLLSPVILPGWVTMDIHPSHTDPECKVDDEKVLIVKHKIAAEFWQTSSVAEVEFRRLENIAGTCSSFSTSHGL